MNLNEPRKFEGINLLDPEEVSKYDENDTMETLTHFQDIIDWGNRCCCPDEMYHMATAMQELLDEYIKLEEKYIDLAKESQP